MGPLFSLNTACGFKMKRETQKKRVFDADCVKFYTASVTVLDILCFKASCNSPVKMLMSDVEILNLIDNFCLQSILYQFQNLSLVLNNNF